MKKVNDLANEFSNLVLGKVINAKEVSGAYYFIEKYYSKLKFWIITGTPNDEIKIIAEKRKLTKFFRGIHGSPKNKRYWTEFLLKKYNLKRNETIFLGDATTDLDAAKFSKTHFALRENEENKELFNEYTGMRFNNFYELESLLNIK